VSWFRSSRRRRSPEPSAAGAGFEAAVGESEPLAAEAPRGEPPADARPAADDLRSRPLADLHELAARVRLPRYRLLRREQLIAALATEDGVTPPSPDVAAPPPAPTEEMLEEPEGELRVGVLDLVADGFGFVRLSGFARSPDDPYVSRTLVRQHGLRRGDEVGGPVQTLRTERHPRMVGIETVEGRAASDAPGERPLLDEAQVRRPSRPLATGDTATARMVEMVTPLGFGQRVLIAGSPGAGATTLLRKIADGLRDSGTRVSVALVDVRPEEVPEWQAAGVAVQAAPADASPRDHVALAELALERAKRIAEQGEDAVLLLDSISRLARAYGLLRGRTGEAAPAPELAGVEAAKRWFGAARDAGYGSLTLIATARVESESRLETLVHEALADAANVIVRLDSGLAARGLHPALDVRRSRTAGEEALLGEDRRRTLESVREVARSLDPFEAWQFLAARAREA
jgi:transcription termination factor Rho